MRIAFFDSGIGGLTVLKLAIAARPDEEYLYYADTRHVPYGVKPKDEVRAYILDAVDFLAKQDIQALVVACNTATSIAINELRARYTFPIIGMEPAVKPALVNNNGRKVLVFATSLTLRESKLASLITKLDKAHRVERRELDGLVTFAENLEFDTPAVHDYLEKKLADMDWSKYETIVLGCTHFIYYRDMIRSLVGPAIQVIDGNEGTVNHLLQTLGLRRCPSGTAPALRVAFYSSGIPDNPERTGRLLGLLK